MKVLFLKMRVESYYAVAVVVKIQAFVHPMDVYWIENSCYPTC